MCSFGYFVIFELIINLIQPRLTQVRELQFSCVIKNQNQQLKTIAEEITGNLTIKEDTTYHNIFAETVVVGQNVVARFYGIINGDIILERGATAYLHGKLQGNVINRGGILYVFNAGGAVEAYTSENSVAERSN